MTSGIIRTIVRLPTRKCYLLLLAVVCVLLIYLHFSFYTTRNVTNIDQVEIALATKSIKMQKDRSVPTIANGDIIGKVRLDVFDLKKVSDDQSKCYPLRIQPPAKICVHSDKDDIYVSKNLRVNGIWERDAVDLFQKVLKRNPQLDVFDIGANLGLYSLTAAAMGREVLSVEPLDDNIRHFHKSVKLNAFEDRITLVTNAVSNKREKVHFKIYSENKGGTSMWEGKEACKDRECPYARSVYMDDLVPLVKARNITNAVMKMDIEGAEHLALAEASQFFSTVNIAMIFMEVAIQRNFCGQQGPVSEDQILTNKMFKFLQGQGFTRVFTQSMTGKQLKPSSCSKDWPRDVVWVKETQVFPP